MNAIERVSRRVDGFQQGHKGLSVVYAVMKKYGDDNAGVLVSSLTLSAFGTVFPLLLLLVTILGLVLSGDKGLYNDVLHSALNKFPIIGNNLAGNIHALHRNSALGLVVGIGGLTWGSLGLAQNGIFTMEQVWNLPGTERPNYIKRLGRSFGFLALLGVGLIVTTFLAAAEPTEKGGSLPLAVAGGAVSAIVNFGEYLFAFRMLTPSKVPLKALWPGAALAGAGWTLLQAFGGFVVGHYLRNDSAVYGLFGLVLGLLAWVFLIVELTVYSAELNVVLARHLWPRSIVQPPLTDADRRSMAAQAEQNRRRPEQLVHVTFEEEVKA
ncbi:MAG TPA: YihY/virulence factor BrkB family protein [Acidimicrobiales bacterium]|nr:YihY/virulence factor BrkB family protein [Acidimicrobiales bacterium]